MSGKKPSGCKRAAVMVVVAVAFIFCIIPMSASIISRMLDATPPATKPVDPQEIKRKVAESYRSALSLAESGQTGEALILLAGIEPNARSSGIEIAINLKTALELIEDPAAALAFLVKTEIEAPERLSNLRAGDCPESLKCGGPNTEERVVLALQALLPELPAAVEAERKAMAERAAREAEAARAREIAAIEAEEKAKADAAANRRAEQIARQFSGWDKSHIGLVERVKASMHNPASFEHVQTLFRDNGRALIVTMKFRGTNKFNAVVTQVVVAEVTYEGAIVSVSEF